MRLIPLLSLGGLLLVLLLILQQGGGVKADHPSSPPPIEHLPPSPTLPPLLYALRPAARHPLNRVDEDLPTHHGVGVLLTNVDDEANEQGGQHPLDPPTLALLHQFIHSTRLHDDDHHHQPTIRDDATSVGNELPPNHHQPSSSTLLRVDSPHPNPRPRITPPPIAHPRLESGYEDMSRLIPPHPSNHQLPAVVTAGQSSSTQPWFMEPSFPTAVSVAQVSVSNEKHESEHNEQLTKIVNASKDSDLTTDNPTPTTLSSPSSSRHPQHHYNSIADAAHSLGAGMIDTVTDALSGLSFVVQHPIVAGAGTLAAASHPIQTGKHMLTEVKDAFHDDPLRATGRAIGDVLLPAGLGRVASHLTPIKRVRLAAENVGSVSTVGHLGKAAAAAGKRVAVMGGVTGITLADDKSAHPHTSTPSQSMDSDEHPMAMPHSTHQPVQKQPQPTADLWTMGQRRNQMLYPHRIRRLSNPRLASTLPYFVRSSSSSPDPSSTDPMTSSVASRSGSDTDNLLMGESVGAVPADEIPKRDLSSSPYHSFSQLKRTKYQSKGDVSSALSPSPAIEYSIEADLYDDVVDSDDGLQRRPGYEYISSPRRRKRHRNDKSLLTESGERDYWSGDDEFERVR